MKRKISMMLLCMVALSSWAATTSSLSSPDGRLTANVVVADSITIDLKDGSTVLLKPSTVAMQWADGTVWGGTKTKVKKVQKASVNTTIKAPVYKRAQVKDSYNQITVVTGQNFDLEVRLYDDGLAYRFVSKAKGARRLKNEKVVMRFNSNYTAWAAYARPGWGDRKGYENYYHNDMESRYEHQPLKNFSSDRLLLTPMVVEGEGTTKLTVAEADCIDYPGMYMISSDAEAELKAHFAPVPSKIQQGGHNNLEMLGMAYNDYIADIDGPRAMPWRTVIVTRNDAALAESDMVYRLATPQKFADTSWIKPGKVAWDWWNNWGLYDVGFKAGINNRTYEYYIDFAAKYGVEYVILDEGWATTGKADLMDVVPEINLQHIVDYANKRGVGIILWAGVSAIKKDMSTLVPYFAKMGVKGFKIDFLNRDDQEMMRFMLDAAKLCADNHMLIDFHGCPKPSGLNRTYPNVINFEGVFGQEQMKWSGRDVDMMQHDVTLPFTRMVGGPLDYTQGAMNNATKNNFAPSNDFPMSQGTRCHQLGLYMVFESPLNMLCDSPSNYERNAECTSFIASIPTTWDETRVLDAKVGEYVVTARRKGNAWYVGAITNWTARDIMVTLPAECAGKTRTEFADGPNSYKLGQDYTSWSGVQDGTALRIQMSPGGGYAAVIK